MSTELVAVALRQHGVFSRAQAFAAGLSAATVKHRVQRGEWVRVELDVYRHQTTPVSWRGRVMAACLASGGVASHRAAARLHGLTDGEVVEVTVWRTRDFRATGAVAHWLTDLDPAVDVTVVDGIPTTTVARTLVDLGAVCPVYAVEKALERALSRRLVTIDPVVQRMNELSRRGRAGVGRLRMVLAARGIGGPAGSDPETTLLQILRRHGFPTPVRQYELRVGGRTIVIDVAFPDDRIAIEYDGIDVHIGMRALEQDNAKSNLIVLAGWILVRYTKARLRQPAALCAEVERAFDLARSRGA